METKWKQKGKNIAESIGALKHGLCMQRFSCEHMNVFAQLRIKRTNVQTRS